MNHHRFDKYLLSAILILTSSLASTLKAQETKPLAVDPEELTKHRDWIGRDIVVDDRVAIFQWHPKTLFDQIFLKRAPEVAFDLPPNLRTAKSPQAQAVRLRGILSQVGGRWVVDVTQVEILPNDIDRLTRALAILPSSDTVNRNAWASWAEKRGKAFEDPALIARALEVKTAALRVEADKPKGDKYSFWLALVERARQQEIDEPEPSAIAHRAFQHGSGSAKSVADYQKLIAAIEKFLPDANKSLKGPVDLSTLQASYDKDPAPAYRSASPDQRAALDRKLWEGLTERRIRQAAIEDPKRFLELADEAAKLLPGQLELASGLLESGLKNASVDVASLRQSEVESLALLYRERLHQPDKAKELYKVWLDDQRKNRLSPRDADGRVALAQQYETLVNDEATSVALLQEAWKLDPTSPDVEQIFLRKRYRKVDGNWLEGAKGDGAQAATSDKLPAESAIPAVTAAPAAASDRLRNATPDEVRTRMSGNPNRRVRSRSQGELIEQWIYYGTRENFYINLRRKSGDLQARVVTFYALPRRASDPRPTP